jgi:hypothetical protein
LLLHEHLVLVEQDDAVVVVVEVLDGPAIFRGFEGGDATAEVVLDLLEGLALGLGQTEVEENSSWNSKVALVSL